MFQRNGPRPLGPLTYLPTLFYFNNTTQSSKVVGPVSSHTTALFWATTSLSLMFCCWQTARRCSTQSAYRTAVCWVCHAAWAAGARSSVSWPAPQPHPWLHTSASSVWPAHQSSLTAPTRSSPMPANSNSCRTSSTKRWVQIYLLYNLVPYE